MSGCWLGLEFALNIVKKGKSCQDNFSLRALSRQLPSVGHMEVCLLGFLDNKPCAKANEN